MAPDRCREKSRPHSGGQEVRMAKQATVSMDRLVDAAHPDAHRDKAQQLPLLVRHRGQGPVLQFGDPGAVSTWVLSPFKTDKD